MFADGTTQTTASLGGTITSVGPGTALTGKASSGAATLNIDTTKVPLLASANNFSAANTFSNGINFNDGTSQTTAGAPQLWSSTFPMTFKGFVQTAPPYGSGTPLKSNPSAVSLPLPQSCTASNFSVSVVGSTGTSTASFLLDTQDTASLVANNANALLSCTVTASAGNVVSCSSSETRSLTTPLYLLLVSVTSNSTDFNNARAYVSFLCR